MDSLDHKALLDCEVKLEFQALVHRVRLVLLGPEETLVCLVYQD